MDNDRDILIEDADKKIAQYEGLAAMFRTFADDTRKYKDALCQDREIIHTLTEQVERAEQGREQAEAALELERRRPINTFQNCEIGELVEQKYDYGRSNIQSLSHTGTGPKPIRL